MSIKKIYPYQYVKPHRIDILPNNEMSHSITRYDENDSIRFGFGQCNTKEKEHVDIVEIDYAWLSVIFHIISSSECENNIVSHINVAKNDMDAVANIVQEFILLHLQNHPKKLLHVLNIVHESSREQGHLEIINHLKEATGASFK